MGPVRLRNTIAQSGIRKQVAAYLNRSKHLRLRVLVGTGLPAAREVRQNRLALLGSRRSSPTPRRAGRHAANQSTLPQVDFPSYFPSYFRIPRLRRLFFRTRPEWKRAFWGPTDLNVSGEMTDISCHNEGSCVRAAGCLRQNAHTGSGILDGSALPAKHSTRQNAGRPTGTCSV